MCVDKSHLGVLHKHQNSILNHCLGWTSHENTSWGCSKGCLPTKQLVKMQTEQKKDILFSRSYKRPLYTSAKEERNFLYISWTFNDSTYKVLDCKTAFLMATTSHQASINKSLLDRKGDIGIVVYSPTVAFSINKNIFSFQSLKACLNYVLYWRKIINWPDFNFIWTHSIIDMNFYEGRKEGIAVFIINAF